MATMQADAKTQLAPDLLRLIAPNPSPMTYWGTNSYLIGHDELALIDPGPDLDAHFDAIVDTIGPRKLSAILVTHTHIDHSPLSKRMSDHFDAPIYAFGTALSGRSSIMDQLAADGLAGGTEGLDYDFRPDITLKDGDIISSDEWEIEALHTPGHCANHMAFRHQDRMFCGDHLMGWASTLVSPPDGDLSQFMATSQRLREARFATAYPGHGDPIEDPSQRLDWLITHRKSREQQILAILENSSNAMELDEITAMVYTDIDPKLHSLAKRNTFAHIIDLWQREQITAEPKLAETAKFKKNSKKCKKALDLPCEYS